MNLFDLQRGDSPLVIDIPHAGTAIPDTIDTRLTAAARPRPDTDWHVEKLYGFASAMGATVMVATQSRYVVDLNRDPSGTPLYPGADNSEVCPLRTFADESIYREGHAPDPREVAARIEACFAPYHGALADEIELVRKRHGFAVLLDAHSIRSHVPRFFAGRLPDLNLGSARGASCAQDLERVAYGVLSGARGFSHVRNGRFTGGYITRFYGRPDRGIHALQLEMAQACYMDEAPPYRWAEAAATPLIAVLRRLVATLLAWRPDVREDAQ